MLVGPDNTSWGHKSTLIPTTWNPADKAAECTLSNGNLTASFSVGDKGVRGIQGIDIESATGAYLEFTMVSAALDGFFGIATAAAPLTGSNCYADAGSWLYALNGGGKVNTSSAAYGSSYVDGYVGMMTIADGKVWWGLEGTWFDSGDPASGTNPAFSGLTGVVYPYANNVGGGTARAFNLNCGQSPFAYNPPSGIMPGWGVLE